MTKSAPRRGSRLTGDSGLRRRLSITLVGVALVSVLLLAAVNYVFAHLLIDDSVESQLGAVRETRVQALEIGAERLQSRVSALAGNPSVADALTHLSDTFGELDDDISAGDVEELTALYAAETLPPFLSVGVDLDPQDFVPGSVAGRYLQQQYIIENPNEPDERSLLDDAGDGSGYSAAHRKHHPLLRELMTITGMSDLLLVDIDTGDVVYSAMKRTDLGTNAITGAHADSGLGEAIDRLSTVAVGSTVITDSDFYVPTSGEPVVFLAAAVRSGVDVVGAVVTEVPVDAITRLVTADQDWQRLGLGRTGDVYVVGGDRTLRTDTRAWLQDPDDYLDSHLDRYDERDATNLMEIVGSAVLVHEVDNEAVTEALDGNQFTGIVTNHLGATTLAASSPVEVGNLNWAVVVELERSEADSAVNSLLRRFLIVLAILLPSIAVLGVILARTLTKPVDSLVRSASRIADGDLDTPLEDLGQNELGDLGRQLEGVARQLRMQEHAIGEEERHINDILTALLPPRLVERVRDGEQAIGDLVDTATVISITIDDHRTGLTTDNDLMLDIANRLNELSVGLAEQHGVERVQRSPGSQLFVAGLGHADARISEAIEFTLAGMRGVADVAAEFGHELTARAGIATGDIATGVLGSTQISFGAWGDPTGTAMTLASLAQPGQLLVDGSVVDGLDDGWDIEAVTDLPGLADDITAHAVRNRPNANIAAAETDTVTSSDAP